MRSSKAAMVTMLVSGMMREVERQGGRSRTEARSEGLNSLSRLEDTDNGGEDEDWSPVNTRVCEDDDKQERRSGWRGYWPGFCSSNILTYYFVLSLLFQLLLRSHYLKSRNIILSHFITLQHAGFKWWLFTVLFNMVGL